jgi:hypothetical protein
MTDSIIDFATGAPATGTLAVSWIHGAPARQQVGDPPIQVHRYDGHTVILRQSKSVHYEAPFLYLIFGNDRALLLDTGATADPAVALAGIGMDEHLAAEAGMARRGVVVHLDGQLHVEGVGLDSTADEIRIMAFAGGFLVEEAHAAAVQRRGDDEDYVPVHFILVAARCLGALVPCSFRRFSVSYAEIHLWHCFTPSL